MNKIKFRYLSKITSHTSENYPLYALIIAFGISFLTIPIVLISLVLTAFLFQNLYWSRKYALSTLKGLTITMFILAWEFFRLYLSINSLYYYFILLIPIGLYIYDYTRKKKDTTYYDYTKNSWYTFSLLLMGFAIAWFSGGILNYATASLDSIFGLGYFNPLDPLLGLFDFFSAFVTITASPWFMICIGIWLGILAFFKLLEVRNRENRIRIALMMIAYAFYSIWLPSFSPIASKVSYIPYMWFNGLGTYGPVQPSYLLSGIIGTYAVTALISFMFGSRQICSVTCTAPFMLQGTFQDSVKKFNRTSKIGRKMLTSRLQAWYKILVTVTWISLIIFAIISYLDYEGITNITFLGEDPTMFYVALYFNFIWYLQFIFMPFLGNYACVNQGICAWGTFNQFFGYLGFFRLKVKDPKQCVSCKTVDCALACPVGLTDMRASFIKKGEFKSFKCVGVGDCIEACPYDNIFIYDVRKAVKESKRKIARN